MVSRGRSTDVSRIAIARRVSFEPTLCPSLSRSESLPQLPPPPSIFNSNDHCNDTNDLNPSSSVDHRVLDNTRLAKIFLLDLTGVHVTDDNDPRIIALRDGDFVSCLAPPGRLSLDDVDQQSLLVAQRCQDRLRLDRLRTCERVWDDGKRRFRHERLLFLRAREHALAREKQRQREERDTMAELERTRYKHRLRNAASSRSRGLVSYNSLSPLRAQDSPSTFYVDEPFQYPFMTPSTLRSAKYRNARPKTPVITIPVALRDPSNPITFKDVLSSMHGPLFPPGPAPAPATTHRTELLNTLLQQEHANRTQDKAKSHRLERTPSYRSSRRSTAQCAVCFASAARRTSTSSTTSILSSSSDVRSSPSSLSGSWLSFGSRGSISTAQTTPPTSPISSWLKKSSHLKSPSAASNVEAKNKPLSARHSCHSRLTRVDISASPLDSIVPKSRIKHALPRGSSQHDRDRDQSQTNEQQQHFDNSDVGGSSYRSKPLVVSVAQTVSSFLELVKGFHVTATIFSITVDPQQQQLLLLSSDHSTNVMHPLEKRPTTTTMNLKPPGYRVPSCAASIFSRPPVEEPETQSGPSPYFIPLLPTRNKQHYSLSLSSTTASSSSNTIYLATPNNNSSTNLPCLRTPLPNPLPTRVFPPPPPLPRSPLRPRDPPPAGSVFLRIRPVANPALLRLRALQNVLGERGVGWEGRAREGGLGERRERLCRVAFEGLGRSALACEVRCSRV